MNIINKVSDTLQTLVDSHLKNATVYQLHKIRVTPEHKNNVYFMPPLDRLSLRIWMLLLGHYILDNNNIQD